MKNKVFVKLLSMTIVCLFIIPLASCAKPPELYEIQPTIESLIEASGEINTIFFGEGLKTEPRLESPYENYQGVAFETGYFSIDDIKDAAEKVYTKEYLNPIYEVIFTGRYDQIVGGIVRARYLNAEGYLLKYLPPEEYSDANGEAEDPNDILGDGIRAYDYSTIQIIKPSSDDYVTFTIMSSKNDKSEKITLAIAMTENGWRLDYPTY